MIGLILKGNPNTPPCQSASIGISFQLVIHQLKAEMFTNLDFDQHDCSRLYIEVVEVLGGKQSVQLPTIGVGPVNN